MHGQHKLYLTKGNLSMKYSGSQMYPEDLKKYTKVIKEVFGENSMQNESGDKNRSMTDMSNQS